MLIVTRGPWTGARELRRTRIVWLVGGICASADGSDEGQARCFAQAQAGQTSRGKCIMLPELECFWSRTASGQAAACSRGWSETSLFWQALVCWICICVYGRSDKVSA